MDLARFESRKYADDGVDFPLVNIVTGETVIGKDGKPVTFRMGHIDGSRIRAAVNSKRKQRAEERKESATKAVDPEQPLRDACEDLAEMTTGWSDNFDLDGQPCTFSRETAAAIFFRFPEILEQMGRNAGDRSGFLLGLAKS